MDRLILKIKSIFNREKMKTTFTSGGAKKTYSSLACVLISLIIGLIIMICLSPADAFYEFGFMLSGGLTCYGSEGFGHILATMAPLLCCGVGIIFAYRTGIFNIGAAGQYILGAFGALIFSLQFKLPWIVCIFMAMIFGAAWGVIPALLKVHFNVNEIISGIMLNWIGLFFVNYSLQTYLFNIVEAGNSYQTYAITDAVNGSPTSALPNFGADTNVIGPTFSCAFLIAIIISVIAFILIEKTIFGYQLKASGYNRHATRYAGINAKRNAIITMAISGAIVGLGASLYYLSGIECWSSTISTVLPQVPWNGIVVAFISQLNPIASIAVAFFLAFISVGSTAMNQSIFPREMSDLIVAVIVYLSGLSAFMLRILPMIKNKFNKLRKKTSPELKEGVTDDSNSLGGE